MMLRTRLLWSTLGFVSTGSLMANFLFKDLWLDRNNLSSQLKQFDALDSRISNLELVLPSSNPGLSDSKFPTEC